MKLLYFIFLLFVSGCSLSSHHNYIYKTSKNLGFIEHKIKTKPFLLTSHEHVKAQKSIANLYIEGDGQAWLNKNTPSLDPTPKNPLALKLALADTSNNVIYLSRPCQYTKTADTSPCDQKYWTSHRFAPKVIKSMNDGLNDMKHRHAITGFNLIGFSGGGNITALLAAQRDDILSIRTVAGNLDHQLQSQLHSVSRMPESLNAKDVAYKISHIPQLHFIGEQDRIVPKEIYDSYKKSSDQSHCVKSHIVEGVSHTTGWKSVWKSLLDKPVDCSKSENSLHIN